MPDSDWDWPADGRTTGRTKGDNLASPGYGLGRRASGRYLQLAVLASIGVLAVVSAGWLIWSALSGPGH